MPSFLILVQTPAEDTNWRGRSKKILVDHRWVVENHWGIYPRKNWKTWSFGILIRSLRGSKGRIENQRRMTSNTSSPSRHFDKATDLSCFGGLRFWSVMAFFWIWVAPSVQSTIGSWRANVFFTEWLYTFLNSYNSTVDSVLNFKGI